MAKHYGINQKTVAKWKRRTSVADLPTGPKDARSTVLSLEEAIVVAFRKHTLLPLDDCLYALQATIPQLTRSSQRNGTFREEALLRGVAVSSEGQEMGGMGAGVGDYNLDGHTDIVRTHYYNQATGLYRNNGKGDFDDVSVEAGLIGKRALSGTAPASWIWTTTAGPTS